VEKKREEMEKKKARMNNGFIFAIEDW